MFNLMCDDLEQARLNRERDNTQTNEFYAQQARAVAQWTMGEPKPESVILGELPYVGKIGREIREED